MVSVSERALWAIESLQLPAAIITEPPDDEHVILQCRLLPVTGVTTGNLCRIVAHAAVDTRPRHDILHRTLEDRQLVLIVETSDQDVKLTFLRRTYEDSPYVRLL